MTRFSLRFSLFVLLAVVTGFRPAPQLCAQTGVPWRAATQAELESVLPSRAPVVDERIETEMRTASGIVNSRGQTIAAVVLITAGYAADGKYSHYLLLQAPLTLERKTLGVGAYVVGWSRVEEGLAVHVFDADTGVEQVTLTATPLKDTRRVESFRIWPPAEHPYIQIGRYMLHYALLP